MTYAVSPAGIHQHAEWQCTECPQHGLHDPGETDGAVIRTAGSEHVELTGHQVQVFRGTVETLAGMATARPPLKAIGP